jgi:polyisoprenoid-binding protein YceI
MTNAANIASVSATDLTGTWSVDPVHSRLGFAAKHLGINIVKGRFEKFEGLIEIPEDVLDTSASGVVETASITTHFGMRDDHVRSAAFLDTDAYPQMSFVSGGSRTLDDGQFEVSGKLTLRGVTRPLTLLVELRGTAVDQFGNERLGLHASGELRLREFGIPYDEHVAGVPIVANTVQLRFDVEAIRQPESNDH